MNLGTKVYGALLGLVLAGVAVRGWQVHLAHKNSYTCNAGKDEKCPPSEMWVQDARRVKAFTEKYKAPTPPKDELDQMQGVIDRLRRDIPPGMEWDDKKEVLVPAKNPPQPQVPQTVVPVEPATVKK